MRVPSLRRRCRGGRVTGGGDLTLGLAELGGSTLMERMPQDRSVVFPSWRRKNKNKMNLGTFPARGCRGSALGSLGVPRPRHHRAERETPGLTPGGL